LGSGISRNEFFKFGGWIFVDGGESDRFFPDFQKNTKYPPKCRFFPDPPKHQKPRGGGGGGGGVENGKGVASADRKYPISARSAVLNTYIPPQKGYPKKPPKSSQVGGVY
jgi:hypothetical protein